MQTFKSGLKMYYRNALTSVYSCDDLRTWKSVCVKCKKARSLNGVISCCWLSVMSSVCCRVFRLV